MRIAALVILASEFMLASAVSAQESARLEIRFCPSAEVRTFPLESRRGVQSLLLQNAVVINHGPSSAEITDVTLELLQDREALDSRRIAGIELKSAAASGRAIQQSGMMAQIRLSVLRLLPRRRWNYTCGPVPCARPGASALPATVCLHGQARLPGVRVHAKVDGRNLEITAALPIRSGLAKTAFRFPLQGVWFAGAGPTMHSAHRWALPEEFAYDIVRLGEGHLSHRRSGTRFADYYAYGAPVLAAAGGVVTAAVNDQPEDTAAPRRPEETDEAYARVLKTRRPHS